MIWHGRPRLHKQRGGPAGDPGRAMVGDPGEAHLAKPPFESVNHQQLVVQAPVLAGDIKPARGAEGASGPR
jgi:hypothetical protein